MQSPKGPTGMKSGWPPAVLANGSAGMVMVHSATIGIYFIANRMSRESRVSPSSRSSGANESRLDLETPFALLFDRMFDWAASVSV